jgi:hydrogenase nickel incorporation protein HypB
MCAICGCGSDAATLDGKALHGPDHAQGDHAQGDHVHDGHMPGDHTHGSALHGGDNAHHHLQAHAHGHSHGDDHALDHARDQAGRTHTIGLELAILAENDRYAAHNRRRFTATNTLALNLVSSPGSGKTALLVRTIAALAGTLPIAVIEGDQQTSADADRIRAAGAPAVQINTGKGCHLDAHMVGHALDHLTMPAGGILFIENVGNLVCPAAFDLGEAAKVAIVSVTEGEDKPLKYPDMFAAARLVLVNKIDLAPHVDADVALLIANARRVNPDVTVLCISARTGEGLDAWLAWLDARRIRPRSPVSHAA